MTRTEEMEGLSQAINLLQSLKIALIDAPMAIYLVVLHAQDALNQRLGRMLRGAE